ncbi:MAG: lectin like domain-containing protein [Oscillospiraceae bacterium]|nr:lectin like domain-containing protein [Oscillospiraceae bacterium]
MPALEYLGPYASDYGTDEIVMANVFTASDHQMLRTVGVITAEPDTTVAVQVYRLNADAEDPTDGTPLLETPATATFEYSGYHRVGLRDYGDEDEAFAVDAGERFSVVVRMSIEDDTYVSAGASFSIQCLDETEGINWYAVGVINEGESYVGEYDADAEDYVWTDWTELVLEEKAEDDEIEYDNLAIKAYSDLIYTITVGDAAHGAVTSDHSGAIAGAAVTLTVTDGDGGEIVVTDCTFTMPSGDVTVAATFVSSDDSSGSSGGGDDDSGSTTTTSTTTTTTTTTTGGFTDVSSDAYYADAVVWAVENGLPSARARVHSLPTAAAPVRRS